MAAWSCDACTFRNDDDALATCQVCHAVRVVSCAKCHGEIKAGPRLRVSGELYHPDCFTCSACHQPFPTPKFSIKDGKPFHAECLPKDPVVPCTACHRDIGVGPRLTVAGQLYHPNCFVCKKCRQPFPTHQFLVKDGEPYHPNCVPGTIVAKCAKCRHEIGLGPRLTVAGEPYHPDCFTCTGCHEPLGGQKFQIKDNEPYHMECFKLLYNPRCEVCDDYIPFKADGKSIAFKEVPYWNMRFCPSHDTRARCYSCQRIEPLAPEKHFDILNDGRKVCRDCCMLAIMDTIELQNVVAEVWEFMESSGMQLPKLPVYLVESHTLNENCERLNRRAHDHSSNKPMTGHVTRGLCLSEVTKVKHMIAHGGVPEIVSIDQNRSVNAILILHGLPYDLTAQIVAHEATHAYIKLSESFPDHLPLMVEEGMCQLMSYLYLKYKQALEEDRSAKKRGLFHVRLREFLVQQIEADQTPVYGDGFRAAHAAYTRVHSLQTMFDSLRRTGQFP